MTNLNDKFEAFDNRTGLYRVWVPATQDSIWIDPMVSAFKAQAHEELVTIAGHGEEEIAEESEEPAKCTRFSGRVMHV
jgi:hypothetical protein